MQLEAIKAEGSPDNLAKRTAARLIEKSELVLRRASAAIRLDLDTTLARSSTATATSAWEPFGPTTRPTRTSPACAIAKSWKTGSCPHSTRPSTGRTKGFALADGWDGQKYTGLVLPTDPAGEQRATVDSLLLVKPRRAEDQRAHEVPPGAPEPPGPPPPVLGRIRRGRIPPGLRAPPPAPPRPEQTRYFGTVKLNPDFYARDFGKITSEVIQHLAAVDGVQLEVRLEITAVANNGFDRSQDSDDQENAQTLKFEQSGFEAE